MRFRTLLPLAAFVVLFLAGAQQRGLALDADAHTSETIVLLAEDDYFPYSSRGESGQAQGICVDLVRRAFANVGIRVRYETSPFDRAMARVRDGQAVACFNTPREERIEKDYIWPRNMLYRSQTLFYARRDFLGRIDEMRDLDGLRLGLTMGYGYGDAIARHTGVEKVWGRSDEMNMRKLLAGRIDLVAQNPYIAQRLLARLRATDRVKPVGTLPGSRDMYIVFSARHPQGPRLAKAFDRGFDILRQSNEYARIFARWEERLKASVRLESDPAPARTHAP